MEVKGVKGKGCALAAAPPLVGGPPVRLLVLVVVVLLLLALLPSPTFWGLGLFVGLAPLPASGGLLALPPLGLAALLALSMLLSLLAENPLGV